MEPEKLPSLSEWYKDFMKQTAELLENWKEPASEYEAACGLLALGSRPRGVCEEASDVFNFSEDKLDATVWVFAGALAIVGGAGILHGTSASTTYASAQSAPIVTPNHSEGSHSPLSTSTSAIAVAVSCY